MWDWLTPEPNNHKGHFSGHEAHEFEEMDHSKHDTGAPFLEFPVVVAKSEGATESIGASSEDGSVNFDPGSSCHFGSSHSSSSNISGCSANSSAAGQPMRASPRFPLPRLARLTRCSGEVREDFSRVIKPVPVRTIRIEQLVGPFKTLGQGEFCVASLATLDGNPVVIKRLRVEQRENPTAAKDLASEISMMTSLRHAHILGALAQGKDEHGLPFLVLEKLDCVLSAELPKPSDSVPFWTRRSQVRKWPLGRALRIGIQLAEALHYCHAEVADSVYPGCRVLHRDLKPSNVGFLPDGRLALFDFGLAKLWQISEHDEGGTESRPLTGNTGSLRYMAPEVALNQPYSHKAEVFGFGTILWQMASHERPFAGCDAKAFYRRVCTQHERPKIPKAFPPALAALLTRCWSPSAAERPEMLEVLDRLREILESVEAGLSNR